MVMQLKMDMDDNVGLSRENVKPLSDEYVNALKTIYSRYAAYLDSFGPNKTYLRKKMENELGTRLIYLKMRVVALALSGERLLGNNKFDGSIPLELKSFSLLSDLQIYGDQVTSTGVTRVGSVNGKFGHTWQSKLKHWNHANSLAITVRYSVIQGSLHVHGDACCDNVSTGSFESDMIFARRRLLGEASLNLPAAPFGPGPPVQIIYNRSSQVEQIRTGKWKLPVRISAILLAQLMAALCTKEHCPVGLRLLLHQQH